jgi:drug/metabolite transporter (DMT)-like permease
MLLVHEWNAAPLGGNVLLGIVLAVGGMLAASIANVVQANDVGRGVPMVSFLAWAALYGTIFDLGYAVVTAGPPQVPTTGAFWAGTAYLAIIGSVVTFPLHYNLVRQIGAGKTAYNGIVTVCVAMLLSTLFEGFKWDALSAGGMALALAGMGLALRSKQRR